MLEKNYKLKYTGQEVENLLDKASVSVDSTYVNNQMITATEFKKGMILLWSGATNTIPNGWALCNGQNGTPNLVDRFIVGAGSAYAVGATGGSSTVTLTTAQIPSHTHVASSSITINSAGIHNHTANVPTTASGAAADGSFEYNVRGSKSVTTGNAGNHTHGATVTTTISSTGSDGAHENRPPYYALAYIMKL